MSGRRVLVTGVGGFVGPHLVRAIAARGDLPIGLGERPAPPEIRSALSADLVADVRSLEQLTEAIADARPDAVIHLAGQSSVGESIARPVATLEANAAGTWNLLEAVRDAMARARVLIIGSADVYGPHPEGTRVREDASQRPVSPYGLSKAIAEAAAAFYGERFGLDVVRTRSFAHIGPGQTDRFVVPTLARQVAEIEAGRRESVLQVGNLNITRDLTHVRSVVQAYLALVDRGQKGAVYNVCSGQGVKLSDLATRLVKRARVELRMDFDPKRFRPVDIPYLVGDPEAIGNDTGWKAVVDLEQALDEILEEWRERVEGRPMPGGVSA